MSRHMFEMMVGGTLVRELAPEMLRGLDPQGPECLEVLKN